MQLHISTREVSKSPNPTQCNNHFIPSLFDDSYIDEVEKISDEEAYYYVQLLGKKEGVLVGSSSGAALAGAIKQAYKATGSVNIVAIFPDRSERYFSQNLYNFDMNLSDYRFNDLFDNWATHYDETVYTKKGEYYEVFKNYEEILKETAALIKAPVTSTVIDIGSGTGNLGAAASTLGYHVIGVEPNAKMRELAAAKYPNIPVQNGSFLTLDIPDASASAIISSYAFHHLQDPEKAEAIAFLATKLHKGGQIIITDTMYESPQAASDLLNWAQFRA